jgi:hypothetical protein
MDEQHDRLCFPIPVAGTLFLVHICTDAYLCTVNFIISLASMQFIREYTSKVDDLVKDKIESQNEERAKEKEEKDLVAQQVK